MDSTVTVKFRFEPMDANGEEIFKFESTVVGGAIPKEYIPAVGEGIEEATAGWYSWLDSQLLVSQLTYTMVLTMKSIHLKWHSTLPDLWHSRKL